MITLSQLGDDIPRWAVHNAVRAGRLRRVAPGVYADPAGPIDPLRVATCYANGRGALSHLSALAVWGIREPLTSDSTHVTVARGINLRSTPSIILHRRRGFELLPPDVIERRGHLVTGLDASLVDAWPLLASGEREAILVKVTASRMTLPSRIVRAVERVPRLTGRAELLRLAAKLAQGCQSYLEIFGLDHVFVGPGLPEFVRQFPITVDGRQYYLDVFAEQERVAFELDGAAWHGSKEQREADLRRDAALATQGIMVVRFTYRRLTAEPERVRREVLTILESRR